MDSSKLSQLSADEKLKLVKKILKQKAMGARTSPLSYGQKSLWFIYKAASTSSVYNTAFAIRIEENPEVALLKKVWSQLIKRHPILTTTFHEEKEDLFQQLNPDQPLSFEEICTTNTITSDQEKIKSLIDEPFDLTNGSIYRIVLLKTAENNTILVFSVHHIIYDDWSSTILLKELQQLYNAEKIGEPIKLPEAPLHYFDFVAAQNKMISSEMGQQSLNYWLEQLRGEITQLTLPLDYQRPILQTFNGDSLSFTINRDLTSDLRRLSTTNRVTLNTSLLSVFQILLSKYSGQKDILVGMPVAGRDRSEYNTLIGYFVNPVVIRGNLNENCSLQEFIKKTSKTVLNALTHQEYPFPLLVEQLQKNKERDLSTSPLFQVAFSFLKEHGISELQKTNKIQGITPLEIPIQEGVFDITLELVEMKDHIKGRFKYNTDLFKKETIQQMVRHYLSLLKNGSIASDTGISEISMMDSMEKKDILQFNPIRTPYPSDKTVQEIFENQVVLNPDAIALVVLNQKITYGELNKKANILAAFLKEKYEIEKDDCIGIIADRSQWMILGILGIIKAGAAYVPIDPQYPNKKIEYIIQDTAIKTLLVENIAIQEELKIKIETVILEKEWDIIQTRHITNPVVQNKPTDLIYIMYTSGSTGKPKGVMVEHRNVIRLVKNTNYVDIQVQDRILQLSNYVFDGSTFDIFGALLNGATLCMIPKTILLSEKGLSVYLKKNPVTIAFMTTAFFNNLVDISPEILTQFDTIYFGGESTSIAHVIKGLPYLKTDQSLINVYGPTETTTFSSYYIISPEDKNNINIPIGKPISNTTIYILDTYKNILPVGVPGEIYIGGEGVTRGYRNREEDTREKFVSNPFDPATKLYKTGDYGKILSNGNIVFLGRKDNQIKIRGFRIELEEIEVALSHNPKIRNKLVLVKETEGGQKVLVAFIIPMETNGLVAAEVIEFLRGELSEYMIPQKIIILDRFPLNPATGKIDRNELLKTVDTASLETPYLAPETPEQKQLEVIWKELLKTEKEIGIHDNFFQLGGNSLLAMQVLSRIRSDFNTEIPITDVFKEPTISSVATLIKKNGKNKPTGTITRVSRAKYILKK